MPKTRPSSRKPVILGPGEGRSYPMGRIAALFKADEFETESRYSISEWWLEPHTQGPGAHWHPKDDVFYVIEGTMSVLVGDAWTHATRGSFILVPGGVTHDFREPRRYTSGSAQPVHTRLVRVAHAGHRAVVCRKSAQRYRHLTRRCHQRLRRRCFSMFSLAS